MTRRTIAAGSFYPSGPFSLSRMLSEMCGSTQSLVSAHAVIVPHAGYQFSGAVAGKVLSRVPITDTVIVLSPNHTGLGKRLAVWHKGDWDTPLGTIQVDEDYASMLLDSIPLLQADTKAHIQEHSIEVQLPFLKHLNPRAKIVPICVARNDIDVLQAVGEGIAQAVLSKDALIVASNDMTHFQTAIRARQLDEPAIKAIENINPEEFYSYVVGNGVSICGVLPVTATLFASKYLNAQKADLIEYTHSGVVTGDNRNVVAYAGFVIPK